MLSPRTSTPVLSKDEPLNSQWLAAAYTMMQFARDPNLIGCTTAFGVYMRRERAIEVVEKMIKERAK